MLTLRMKRRVGEEGMTRQEAQEIIMRHSLPKAVSRKNVQLPGYVPEGRLFGAFTTRGEGITQATYRYPKVVQAIHHLASLRGGEARVKDIFQHKSTEPRDCRCIKTKTIIAPPGS